jgi:hypothetical protein
MVAPVYVDPPVWDGRRALERLADAGLPVAAAAWLRSPDSGRWELFVVSPDAGPGQFRAASARARAALAGAGLPPGMVGDLRLYHTGEPFGRDVIAVREGRAGEEPIRGSDGRFGDVTFDAVYVYPSPVETSLGRLLRTAADLIVRPETGRSYVVELKDGTEQRGRPIGLRAERPSQLTWQPDGAENELAIPFDEITDIRVQ